MHERVNEPSIDADCSNHICLKVFYQLLRSPGYHSASQLIPNIGPPASSPQTDQTELRTAPHSNFNCGARSVFERPMKRTPASSGLKSSLATSTRCSPPVRSQRQVGAPFPSNDSICKRLQDHFDRNCHAGHKTLLRRHDELLKLGKFLKGIRGFGA